MLNFKRFGVATLVVTTIPWTASADVTAFDVWTSWQKIAGDMGQTLTSDGEARSGNRLIVSNVTVAMNMPDGAVFAPVGDVVFVENGDGTVAIEFGASYPLRVTGTGAAGEDFDMTVVIRQPDLSLVASGDPRSPSYTYGAPEITITSDRLTIGNEVMDFDLDMSLRSLDGVYEVLRSSEADRRTSIGALAMRLAMEGIEGPDTNVAVNLTAQNIATASSGAVTPLNAAQSMGELLGQGFASTGETTYGPVTYSVSGGDGEEQFEIGGSIESGVTSVQMGAGGLSYGGENIGTEVSVSGTQIPFPDLTFAMERSAATVTLPLAPSEEAQDFGLSTSLSGVTIDDRLWAMFDPGRMLPRDGADFAIDLAGRGNLLVDVTDPAIAETLGTSGEMPGEIESLDIRELRLSVAGLELSGTGAFAFLEGAMGGSRPEGDLSLRLTGSNALLDRLVAMGMLPEAMAVQARLMLGLFARPVAGSDALESTTAASQGQRVT